MESQELIISWFVIVTSQCCVSLCYPDACSLLLNITSFLTDHLVSRYVFLDISFVFCILGSVHQRPVCSVSLWDELWVVGESVFLSAQMLLTIYFISRVYPRVTTSYGLPQGVLPPNLYIHTIPFIPPLLHLHLHIVTVNICQHHPALLACLSL